MESFDRVMQWIEGEGCGCDASPGESHTCIPGIVEQALCDERARALAAEAERDALRVALENVLATASLIHTTEDGARAYIVAADAAREAIGA